MKTPAPEPRVTWEPCVHCESVGPHLRFEATWLEIHRAEHELFKAVTGPLLPLVDRLSAALEALGKSIEDFARKTPTTHPEA